MKIVFFGTGKFSATVLNGLVDNGHNVIAVVTQPDKINARNNKIIPSEVKTYCLQNGIQVFQFNKLNLEGETVLKELNPDMFITASYGQIIKQNILSIPKFHTINVHASLLPKYRGPAPIQWAIINGEKQTGITIMQTDIGVDTGDIILQKELEILDSDTSSSVFDKLATLGVECINEFLKKPEEYLANKIKQDETKSSYYKMFTKQDFLIDFNSNAMDLCNKIRGLENCYFIYKNSRYKVGFASFVNQSGRAGEILSCDGKKGLIIATKDKAIEVISIQPEGKQKMFAINYMNSNKFSKGDIIDNT